MKLLLTYDITLTKSRTKVATLLEGYGYRVNFSVFELDIKKYKLNELLETIQVLCDKNDSIRVYAFSSDTIEKSYDLNKNRPKPFKKKSSYVN